MPILIAAIVPIAAIVVGLLIYNSVSGGALFGPSSSSGNYSHESKSSEDKDDIDGDSDDELQESASQKSASGKATSTGESADAGEKASDSSSKKNPSNPEKTHVTQSASLKAYAGNLPNLEDLASCSNEQAYELLDSYDELLIDDLMYYTPNGEFVETYKSIKESDYSKKLKSYTGEYLIRCGNGTYSISKDGIKNNGKTITNVTSLQVVNVPSVSPKELADYVSVVAPYERVMVDATATDGHLEGFAKGNGYIVGFNAFHFGDIWTVKVYVESIKDDANGYADDLIFEDRYKKYNPESEQKGYKA